MNEQYDLTMIEHGEHGEPMNGRNHVFIYRKGNTLFAHYCSEKRYTTVNMLGWYGMDIEIVAYGSRQSFSDEWVITEEIRDNEAANLLDEFGGFGWMLDDLFND